MVDYRSSMEDEKKRRVKMLVEREKEEMRKEFGRKLLGIKSYDKTYDSNIVLFTKEEYADDIAKFLESHNKKTVLVEKTSKTRLHYRHGATAVVRYWVEV